MRTKNKKVHKTSAEVKAEQLEKAQNAKEQEQLKKYDETTYRPDEELVITGEQFLRLKTLAMMALQSAQQQTFRPTFDMNNKQTGYSKPLFYNDIERILIGLNLLHAEFVDAGKGVLHSELAEEVEANLNKESEKPSIVTD